MRKALLGLVVLATLIVVSGADAQTTYNLPNSLCAIQASNYLFCSQMGTITVNGTRYAVTSVAHINGISSYPASAPVTLDSSTNVGLQNLSTGQEETFTATSATYQNYVLTLNFSGGSLVFDLARMVQPPPCYRGICRISYEATSVVLTLD